ncbi:MAG: hypothetical protein K0B87_06405 [Candidatus Syntrophosphaera sp.]|nr:hypothetical protein [Candidatus Syntrophosphaera sp.]
MKKNLILLTLAVMAMALSAGNSIFSYDGYPFRYYGKDIYSLGMGDTGASDIFRNNTGYGNPALHNLSNRSLFSTGILMGYNAYESRDDEDSQSSYVDNSLDLPHFSLSIPLKKHRLGFQFNSFASGVVANQRETILPDSTVILEKQEMDRYLYKIDLIYSVSLGRNNFGISGNYYFGHDVRSFSQDAGFGSFNAREELARSYKNPGLTLGYLRHYDKLAFGASYSPAAKLSGETVHTTIHGTNQIDYDYKLPSHYAFSVTTLPFRYVKIASDIHYETWKEDVGQEYEDGWKVGLGAAWEPKADYDGNFFLQIPLRAGISYRRLPFRVNANEVDELALSLGITIPLKGDVNRIDTGFQYIKRGDLEQNHLADSSFLLMFGFTGFDILSKAPNRTAPRDIPQKEDIRAW